MVSLANPKTEHALITLASALAEHEGGRVLATHIITVPDQTSLETAAENRERIDATSETLLQRAKTDAEAFDVPIETKTILSHRGIEEVFDAARTYEADTLVMGYGGAQFAGGRVEGALDEITHTPPCDILVLDGKELDLSDVLVPTAGGPSSDLSAEVARALKETDDVEVSLLHIVDEGEKASGRAFLTEWAGDHQLGDAGLMIETGEVETTIGEIGAEYSLVIVGATESGLLSRVIRGSLAFQTLQRLETPVLLAERPSSRSLRERLFGRR